jgi:hypothetical protein
VVDARWGSTRVALEKTRALEFFAASHLGHHGKTLLGSWCCGRPYWPCLLSALRGRRHQSRCVAHMHCDDGTRSSVPRTVDAAGIVGKQTFTADERLICFSMVCAQAMHHDHHRVHLFPKVPRHCGTPLPFPSLSLPPYRSRPAFVVGRLNPCVPTFYTTSQHYFLSVCSIGASSSSSTLAHNRSVDVCSRTRLYL